MMLFTAIVLVVVNSNLIQSQLFDDPCRLEIWGSDTRDGAKLDVPANCTSGYVDWIYPEGQLTLSTGYGHGFGYQLCIEEGGGPAIRSIIETTGGLYRPLPLPTQDHPACTENLYGLASLIADAGELWTYMTAFPYKVVPIQRDSGCN